MFAEFVEDKLLSDQCSAAVQTLHSSGLQMPAAALLTNVYMLCWQISSEV